MSTNPHPLTRQRANLAIAIALAADALQIVLLPLVWGGAISPVDDVIDVATAIALTMLLGWHWSFLPTLALELVPFVDVVPTWTLAAWLATRKRAIESRSVARPTVEPPALEPPHDRI